MEKRIIEAIQYDMRQSAERHGGEHCDLYEGVAAYRMASYHLEMELEDPELRDMAHPEIPNTTVGDEIRRAIDLIDRMIQRYEATQL